MHEYMCVCIYVYLCVSECMFVCTYQYVCMTLYGLCVYHIPPNGHLQLYIEYRRHQLNKEVPVLMFLIFYGILNGFDVWWVQGGWLGRWSPLPRTPPSACLSVCI